MRTVLLMLLLLVGLPACGQERVVYDFRVVNTYPHDSKDFTQGLIYLDGYLYEGTGKKGFSSLSKKVLETGEVLQSKQLSNRYFGEGIEVVGDKLFQLTWQSHMVFVYDKTSFEQLATHYNATEGWGLAYDGKRLILSDGSATLQFMDPETFAPLGKVAVTLDGNPINMLNELEYIDGEVWANVWMTDYIVRIDPETGLVKSYIDLTGLSDLTELGSNEAVLNGIAWDAENRRLFVTGKHWSNLFEIELVRR
jgi:glutamine cyclotransferase